MLIFRIFLLLSERKLIRKVVICIGIGGMVCSRFSIAPCTDAFLSYSYLNSYYQYLLFIIAICVIVYILLLHPIYLKVNLFINREIYSVEECCYICGCYASC